MNKKASKYIKPIYTLDDVWDEKTDKTVKKWVANEFSSYDIRVLDSVYQLFSTYDKFQVDSVRNESVNSFIDEQRKHQYYTLLKTSKELMRRELPHVLDTCSNIFFNNQNFTYLDLLKSENFNFEKKYKQKQIFSVFSPNEQILYKNYLIDIMLLMPIRNRTPILNMEVGLYYRRDSLTNSFLNQLSPRSQKIYKEMIAFFINHTIKKEEVANTAGDFKWNKQTGKYIEIEKYASKGFLDTLFFYTDSIISAKKKLKYNFVAVYDMLNTHTYLLPVISSDIEKWRENKDTFLLKYEMKKIKSKNVVYLHKKMRRDSIPIDTVFKWNIEANLDNMRYKTEEELDSTSFNNYKKYRDTKITDQDSTFLDNVYTRCGYLRDSSEHSRLFFHANAYYLYLADITINKSRAFLTGWNPLYLSTSNKLAIIVLSFLMFFTTLANSNLFTAVFVAFFINFVNNTIFNLGQNFQEIDKSKQTFWLFGLLGILALVTAVNVLFRKFKLPIIYLLINIQLFALLGIFVWLFDSQTIEQQSNYGYLAIIFWGLMVWKYRSYLALPSRK
jgi:hypothetical protein